MKFHRFAIISLTAVLLWSCDKTTNTDSAANSDSDGVDAPGAVKVVKASSFSRMDFEGESGATIAEAQTGPNFESVSYPVEVNRDSPLSGNSSV